MAGAFTAPLFVFAGYGIFLVHRSDCDPCVIPINGEKSWVFGVEFNLQSELNCLPCCCKAAGVTLAHAPSRCRRPCGTFTDGLDAWSGPIGPWPEGAIAVHDTDDGDGKQQNYKLIDWRDGKKAPGPP